MVQISDFIRAVEIIGPLLLSGLLVFLYYRQYRLQKVQYRPSLEISDTEADDDRLMIWLSNYGGGIAKDLRIETTTIHGVESEVYRTDVPLQRAGDDEGRTRERAIGAGEQGVLFVCEPAFMNPVSTSMAGGIRSRDFSSAIRQLALDGNSDFSFSLSLLFRTQLDDTLREHVSPYPHVISFDEDDLKKVRSGVLTVDYELAKELGSFRSTSMDEV